MKPAVAAELQWPGALAVSPELRALIACARAVIDRNLVHAFSEALSGCPSADSLCETAILHGMLGHMHALVAGEGAAGADPILTQRLAGLQRASVVRNMRQTAQLLHILAELEAAGVQAMAFKGPLWAEILYGDIGLRSWSDLDLLVTHPQLSKARHVLLSIGFQDSVLSNPKIMRRGHGSLGQIALAGQDPSLHVELHWEVTAGLSPRSLTSEMLIAHAGDTELLGRRVARPRDVDVLLMTCVDGTRDRWDKVERLLGLGVQICRLDLDAWNVVLDAARENGCFRRLSVAIAHACRSLGLQTDQRLAESLAGDRSTRSLERSLKLSDRPGAPPPSWRKEWAGKLWIVRSEDSAWAAARHAAASIFRPGPADWAAFTVPPMLGWLYYLARPVRFAIKVVKAAAPSGRTEQP